MISRHTDARLLNEIANDPGVRPWIGNPELGALDLSPVAADERNYVLLGPHGGFVCLFLGEGVYECHALFRKEGRGEGALQVAREGADFMFCATPCIEILTRVPDGHVATKMLAEKIGFRPIFFAGIEEFAGRERPIYVWRLGLDDWAGHAGRDYPGIAAEMLRCGQKSKAFVWYNRWAVMSRRPLARLIRYPGCDDVQIEGLEQAPDA